MNETKPAVFSFQDFQINKFSFNRHSRSQTEESTLSVDFNPEGIFYVNEAEFNIDLAFNAFYKGANGERYELVSVEMTAIFMFKERVDFDKIPTYFYRNSIAIIFPYLRAFISSLTIQANIPPLILPIMNLMDLEEVLRRNTKTVDTSQIEES